LSEHARKRARAVLRGRDGGNAILLLDDLSRADLSETDFISVDVKEVNLENAIMGSTTMVNMDLSTTKGLEAVRHHSPSSIGIDTIYQSQGKIPETFLRQAGVPESFLEIMAAITNRPIEYYTCFISYSSKNQDFAERLYADLQSHGVRCWYAPKDMKIGDEIRARIDESIRVYDKLLLVLSEQAIESSWVEYEVEAALAKERHNTRTMLFPVRLDTAILKSTTAWAVHIQDTRHIGNFEEWKDHDSYINAFERLLRDLKAEAIKESQ
jgi:hypothetical protein